MKNITEFILESEQKPYGLPKNNPEYNAVGVDDKTVKEWEDHFKGKKQFEAYGVRFGFGIESKLPKNLHLNYNYGKPDFWSFNIYKNKSGKWFILKNNRSDRRVDIKPWPHKDEFFDSLEDIYKIFDDEKKFK